MLITFTSDNTTENVGWIGHFTSSSPTLCHSGQLDTPTGIITEASGPRPYLPNTYCTFLIMPNNSPATVTLFFTEFNLEANKDFVRISDPLSGALLQTLTGTTIPNPVVSFSGEMFIEFQSDGLRNYQGFTANYTTQGVGIDSRNFISNLNVFPNPASNLLNIRFNLEKAQDLEISLSTTDGQRVYSELLPNQNNSIDKQLDISSFAKGVYFLKLKGESGSIVRKIVIL
jgi:hypothetical protein